MFNWLRSTRLSFINLSENLLESLKLNLSLIYKPLRFYAFFNKLIFLQLTFNNGKTPLDVSIDVSSNNFTDLNNLRIFKGSYDNDDRLKAFKSLKINVSSNLIRSISEEFLENLVRKTMHRLT